MKKILVPGIIAVLSSTALAKGDPQKAIDALWAIPDAPEELPRAAGDFKVGMGDWIKFHQTEPFKFRVSHQAQPVDGYNFIVTYVSCSNKLLLPTGAEDGFEARTLTFKPPVRVGEVAVWEAEKKNRCVNAFACSYEVRIEGIDDPSAKRVFGPIGTTGSTVAPDYDCFLEATSVLQLN